MNIPIVFENHNGSFVAHVLGEPTERAEGRSEAEAQSALTLALSAKVRRGEIRFIQIPVTDWVERAKSVTPEEKEMWDEIVRDIYAERDAQKAAEFPE